MPETQDPTAARDELIARTEAFMPMLGSIFERNPDVHLQTVYDLKVGMGLTWPKLAEKCYELFQIEGSDWDGPDQPYEWGPIPGTAIVGAALCNLTASARGEDFLAGKWL